MKLNDLLKKEILPTEYVEKRKKNVVAEETIIDECVHEEIELPDMVIEEGQLNPEEVKSYFYSRYNFSDPDHVKAVSLDNKVQKYGNNACSVTFTNGSLKGDATIVVNVNENQLSRFGIKREIKREIRAFKKRMNRIIRRFKFGTRQKELPLVENKIEFLILNSASNITKSEIVDILKNELNGLDVEKNVVR